MTNLKIEISGLVHSGKSTIALEIKKLLDSLGIKNTLSDDQDVDNQDKRLSTLKEGLEVEITCKRLQRSGISKAPIRDCWYQLAITDGVDDFSGVGRYTGKKEEWDDGVIVYEFLTDTNEFVKLFDTDTIVELN